MHSPVAASQESSVQASLSLQSFAAPVAQDPFRHVSFSVHLSASTQAVPLVLNIASHFTFASPGLQTYVPAPPQITGSATEHSLPRRLSSPAHLSSLFCMPSPSKSCALSPMPSPLLSAHSAGFSGKTSSPFNA